MPLVSNKAKLIFQHIPKTGGASFKGAIKDYDKDSFNEGSYHGVITRDLANKYPNYYKITVVRNSYTALVSMYRFICIRYLKIEPTVSGFSDWLKTKAKGLSVTQQYAMCKDSDGLIIDEMINFNDLGNSVNKLNKRLGINLDLKKYSWHDYGKYDWAQYYDNKTMKYAYDLCKEDIDYFKWDFNNG